jgi:hypothetical protein
VQVRDAVVKRKELTAQKDVNALTAAIYMYIHNTTKMTQKWLWRNTSPCKNFMMTQMI